MAYADFRQAVLDVCAYTFALGSTKPQSVVWSPQASPRLPKPYVTLYITSPGKVVGLDWQRQDAEGRWRVQGQRKALVSVNSYGLNAIDMLEDFQAEAQTPDVVQYFKGKGVSILDFSAPRDLSVLIDTAFETRGQMDCTFGWISDVATPVVSVEKIYVNGRQIPAKGKL